MTDIEKLLRAKFLEEAEKLLANSAETFLELQEGALPPSQGEIIYRLAHNFKGGAKTVGLDALGDFSQIFESFAAWIRREEISLSQETIDILRRCESLLAEAIAAARADPGARTTFPLLVPKSEDS